LKKQIKAPSEKIKELEEKGKLTAINLEFEHTVSNTKYTLPLEFESQGTRRYYGFAGILALLIKNSTAFPIDELESSLHPDLYLHFLLSFLLNSKNSQIIATTHNREILDNKDIFRNDAIWFTDKQESCSTELYSLTDFDSSVVRNTTNILNAYKSGKLSGTPNLGDTFIDLNP
jgi:AAA15 family ATPase/GTPase